MGIHAGMAHTPPMAPRPGDLKTSPERRGLEVAVGEGAGREGPARENCCAVRCAVGSTAGGRVRRCVVPVCAYIEQEYNCQ